jgi:chromosome segregation ATPase
MGKLLDAVFNRTRKAQEDAAKKIDVDQVTKGRFAIDDAKKEIMTFDQQIRECRATQLDNKKELERVKAEVSKFEGLLTNIKAQGQACKNPDGSVKEGMQAKLDQARSDAASIGVKLDAQVKRRDGLTIDITKGDQLYSRLQTQLGAAKDKVSAAEQNVETLAVRQKSAEMRQRFASAEQGLANSKGLAALGDLAKSVDHEESRAEAAEEMAAVGSTESVEERYATPAGSKHVDF